MYQWVRYNVVNRSWRSTHRCTVIEYILQTAFARINTILWVTVARLFLECIIIHQWPICGSYSLWKEYNEEECRVGQASKFAYEVWEKLERTPETKVARGRYFLDWRETIYFFEESLNKLAKIVNKYKNADSRFFFGLYIKIFNFTDFNFFILIKLIPIVTLRDNVTIFSSTQRMELSDTP